MSLINDALNRAQAEASSKASLDRGEVPAVEGQPRVPARRRPPAWVVLVVALLVLVALLARRWSSTSPPEPERMAEVTAAEPARPRQPVPETVEEPSTVREPSPPSPDPTPTGGRSASRAPTDTLPTAEAAPAATEQALAPASETGSGTSPEATVTEPVASDLPAPEPLREIRASAAKAEVAPQPTAASRPTTIWPSDDADEETWYYVGKVELTGGGEIELDGIVWSELSPSAMLNGSLLTVGSEILGLRVVSIAPRTVTLAGQGQRIALQLGSGTN